MKRPRVVRALTLVAVFAVAVAGCERGYFQEPAQEQAAAIGLSFTFGSAAGGPAEAFDRADRIWIRVRSGTTTRLEQTFPIAANGGDIHLPFEVRLVGASENVTLDVELRRGDAPVFAGTSQISLRVGRTTGASVVLQAVAAALALPDVALLESYGDSVGAHGAIVFATGDTIEVRPLSWTSLDPGVIAIEKGVPVAKADGTARLVAQLGGLTDTLQVRVLAVVRTITVDPPVSSLGLGESRQYTARFFDARGNPILTERPLSWASSDTLVITIAQDGTATGVGVGSARISARSGIATSDVLLQAQPGAPHATTELPDQIITSTALLHATVLSGGMATQVWFEWSLEPTLSAPFTTPKQTVTGGTAPQAVETQISGLQPNTTYFYRVIAQNSAGTSIGETLTFSTHTGAPVVSTGNATNVTQSSATLNGSAVSNGAATAWFEYGTSATLATFTKTPAQTLGAGSVAIGLSSAIAGLQPSTTYWFRLVVSTSAATMTGQVRSFTTPAPPAGAPAAATDSSNSITQTAASLFGRATPNGAATQVLFEYGTDPLLVGASSTAPQAAGAGNTAVPASASIAGLTPGTTYYFRTVASSAVATVAGATLSFTTLAPLPPLVFTDAPSDIGPDSAIANGRVNPRGSSTIVWFEWSDDPTYTTFAASTPQNIGSGSAEVAVHDLIPNLDESTTYYVRTAASNAGGTVRGNVITFATFASGPIEHAAVTLPATALSPGAGTLNGTATANQSGFPTEWWFEYSLDPGMANSSTTPPVLMGADLTPQNVSVPLTGLVVEARYYFRLVVSGPGGRVYGAILNFKAV